MAPRGSCVRFVCPLDWKRLILYFTSTAIYSDSKNTGCNCREGLGGKRKERREEEEGAGRREREGEWRRGGGKRRKEARRKKEEGEEREGEEKRRGEEGGRDGGGGRRRGERGPNLGKKCDVILFIINFQKIQCTTITQVCRIVCINEFISSPFSLFSIFLIESSNPCILHCLKKEVLTTVLGRKTLATKKQLPVIGREHRTQ